MAIAVKAKNAQQTVRKLKAWVAWKYIANRGVILSAALKKIQDVTLQGTMNFLDWIFVIPLMRLGFVKEDILAILSNATQEKSATPTATAPVALSLNNAFEERDEQ